jgi:hypothetical protein
LALKEDVWRYAVKHLDFSIERLYMTFLYGYAFTLEHPNEPFDGRIEPVCLKYFEQREDATWLWFLNTPFWSIQLCTYPLLRFLMYQFYYR